MTSIVDSIPGGRSAYDYIVGKLAEFYLYGTRTLPRWEHVVLTVESAAVAVGDTDTADNARSEQSTIGRLKSMWTGAESQLSFLRSGPSGGPSQAGVELGLAQVLALVAVVGLVSYLLGGQASREAAVADLVQQAVERGTLTPQAGAQLLAGSPGGFTGALNNLVLLAALGIGAYVFIRRK